LNSNDLRDPHKNTSLHMNWRLEMELEFNELHGAGSRRGE
jgi:hypothetical protein